MKIITLKMFNNYRIVIRIDKIVYMKEIEDNLFHTEIQLEYSELIRVKETINEIMKEIQDIK